MKLDTSLAWQRAHGAVIANRDLLLALAGVFFLMPRLALALFAPQPAMTVAPDAAPAQMAARLQAAWMQVAPYALPVLLTEAVGTLALFALFIDRSRPTVREAIVRAGAALFPYLAAQLLFVVGFSAVGGMIVGLAGATGQRALAGLATLVVMGAILYGMVRLALLGPVVVAERIGNPVRALVRAWALTRGNVLAIGLFAAMLALVLVVAMWALVGTLGSLAAILGGPGAARMAQAVIGSLAGSVFSVYFAALLAAFHEQLAGEGEPPVHKSPFG